MVSAAEVRKRLLGSMMGVYVLLNTRAKRLYGRSFEELVVEEPDTAKRLVEKLFGSRAGIIAEIIFGGDNGSFPGGAGTGVEGAGWVDPFPRGFYGVHRFRVLV